MLPSPNLIPENFHSPLGYPSNEKLDTRCLLLLLLLRLRQRSRDDGQVANHVGPHSRPRAKRTMNTVREATSLLVRKTSAQLSLSQLILALLRPPPTRSVHIPISKIRPFTSTLPLLKTAEQLKQLMDSLDRGSDLLRAACLQIDSSCAHPVGCISGLQDLPVLLSSNPTAKRPSSPLGYLLHVVDPTAQRHTSCGRRLAAHAPSFVRRHAHDVVLRMDVCVCKVA
jgi:hypothetical protein